MQTEPATGQPLAELVAAHFPGQPTGYLDTASIGLVPTEVGRAVASCYRALGDGTRGSARWQPVVERATRLYAEELGVAPDEVTFLASTGEAMNALARAVPWRPRDEVLALADDFPTVVLPWTRLGANVRVVQVDPLPGDDRLGALLAALTDRTRLVAVSHVSSFTGTRIDLDVLGAACTQVGALLVCDGAQAAGAIPLSLDAVDVYITAGYKWLLAGFGIAVVAAKQASLEGLRPTLLGHGNVPPSTRLAYGHRNYPGIYALDAAATVRRALAIPRIHARIAEVAARLHQGVGELGYTVAGQREHTAGIVSISGLADPEAVVTRLADAGIAVAARGAYLRLSPHVYTTDDDVRRMLDALATLTRTRQEGTP